jgi:hypothetical protein
LGNLLWAEDVHRREVKRNSPVGWRASFETDLFYIRDSGHVSLLVSCSIFDLRVHDAITMLGESAPESVSMPADSMYHKFLLTSML